MVYGLEEDACLFNIKTLSVLSRLHTDIGRLKSSKARPCNPFSILSFAFHFFIFVFLKSLGFWGGGCFSSESSSPSASTPCNRRSPSLDSVPIRLRRRSLAARHLLVLAKKTKLDYPGQGQACTFAARPNGHTQECHRVGR